MLIMNSNNLEGYRLNFGPQHPAAHGVMRLVINMLGEEIQDVDAQIGLLHRGTEKLLETKTVVQGLPYWDRLDYVSTMSLEYAFSKIVENLCGIEVPHGYRALRVLFVEMTRILNHLLAITTHALDIGALTPFLWGFEEREKLMEFYERVCGARLHANFIRPFGVSGLIDLELILDICFFLEDFQVRLSQIENALTENRIWRERLSYVGILDANNALLYGCTGVILRSTGISYDLRKSNMCNNTDYNYYDFDIPVGIEGDCFDRYILRIKEMYQSIHIMDQALGELLLDYDVMGPGGRLYMKNYMESLILHFKEMSEGLKLSAESSYFAIEAPKGEMGGSLLGNGSTYPWRIKIRSPGYYHLESLNVFCSGGLLADFVTVIGTLDLVLGEIDR